MGQNRVETPGLDGRWNKERKLPLPSKYPSLEITTRAGNEAQVKEINSKERDRDTTGHQKVMESMTRLGSQMIKLITLGKEKDRRADHQF